RPREKAPRAARGLAPVGECFHADAQSGIRSGAVEREAGRVRGAHAESLGCGSYPAEDPVASGRVTVPPWFRGGFADLDSGGSASCKALKYSAKVFRFSWKWRRRSPSRQW